MTYIPSTLRLTMISTQYFLFPVLPRPDTLYRTFQPLPNDHSFQPVQLQEGEIPSTCRETVGLWGGLATA
jgi:hypothetical protein